MIVKWFNNSRVSFMPYKDYIPQKDTIYRDWLANFLTVANANLATLGLTDTDIKPLQVEKPLFDDAITNAETLQAQAKAATEKKNNVRKSSETKARAIVKRIQAKTDVPPELKKQLQITGPGETPAPPTVPYTPKNLVVNVVGIGANELKWERNGNINTIIFIVEAQIDDAKDFVQIFSTRKTNYTHSGLPSGTKISYRVKALHGEISSPYSNIAVI